jgi:hypothetical protein
MHVCLALWDNIIQSNLEWFSKDMLRPMLEGPPGSLSKDLRGYQRAIDTPN